MSTSSLASAGSPLRSTGGGPNWSGRVSANGVTRPQCGVVKDWTGPAHLVAPPGGGPDLGRPGERERGDPAQMRGGERLDGARTAGGPARRGGHAQRLPAVD